MFNWRELSKGFVKGCLIALNMLCIMTALLTFGFAVVDTRILKQYGEERAAGSLLGDMIIILVCIILVAIAILGIVGAVRDHVKMLNLYVICILFVVFLEVLVTIFVSMQRYGLQYRVSEWLQQEFYSNYTELAAVKEHEKLWDDLQSSYNCCGLNGPEDYTALGQKIRVSCCARAYRAKTATAKDHMYRVCIDGSTYYSHGCEDEIIATLLSDADWLFGVAIVSFWFESMGMLLAMWVANYVKNSVLVYKNTVKY